MLHEAKSSYTPIREEVVVVVDLPLSSPARQRRHCPRIDDQSEHGPNPRVPTQTMIIYQRPFRPDLWPWDRIPLGPITMVKAKRVQWKNPGDSFRWEIRAAVLVFRLTSVRDQTKRCEWRRIKLNYQCQISQCPMVQRGQANNDLSTLARPLHPFIEKANKEAPARQLWTTNKKVRIKLD